jgi:hypothetical protein
MSNHRRLLTREQATFIEELTAHAVLCALQNT